MRAPQAPKYVGSAQFAGAQQPAPPPARGRFTSAEPEALARRILLGVLLGVAVLTVSLVGVVVVAVTGRDTVSTAAANGVVSDPHAQLLKLSDLPSGWSVDTSSNSNTTNGPTCFTSASRSGNALRTATIGFLYHSSAPFLGESIRSFEPSQAVTSYLNGVQLLDGCGQISFTSGSTTATGTMARLSFPTVGDESAAYSVAFNGGSGLVATFDVILIHSKNEVAAVLYGDLGVVNASDFQRYVDLAAQKLTS